MVQITTTFKPVDRAAWRAWLEQHHSTAQEIWLLFDDLPKVSTLSYLDAVEEAICFGWIDSTGRRCSPYELALRFSPRRRNSNWSELNKERARRLIRLGLITDAGWASLPDLSTPFTVSQDIVEALKAEPQAWANYVRFPELYRRVRVGNIEQIGGNRTQFERRLSSFVKKTAHNRMFGNWNDGGRLG
jgi:uncharacterized protein YdeI (YjbR/CyaY-like superfamily)